MTRTAPTLVVFTLGASSESARRSLLPAGLKGMEIGLRQACLESALEAGRVCGCRLEVCSPAPPAALAVEVQHVPQPGGDFGSRLERTLDGAFARAAGPVLVVGADVPGLSPRHLDQTLGLLAEDPDRVVLGPSPDGGLYLLAAARPLPALGEAVRWCRKETLALLRRALLAAGREVLLLEPLADLDRPADLEAWLAGPGAHAADVAGTPGAPGAITAPSGERWRMLSNLLRQALFARRLLPPPPRPDAPRLSLSPRLSGRAPPVTRIH